MSKVICDVCGTSYPETATQCPICGCVRPADSSAVSESEQEEGGYTYVKGGRFSKSNVRKRNQGIATPKVAPKAPPKDKKPVNKKLIGLIIVITCLVLILSLLVVFAISQLSGEKEPKNDPVETVEIPCTGLKPSVRTFEFTDAEQSLNLSVTCSPLNTTDKLEFRSTNVNVVTVDDKGNVSFVGNGKADIEIKCGEIQDKCTIICNVPADEPTEPEPTDETTAPTETIRFVTGLIQTDEYYQCDPGTSYVLYYGKVPASEIVWSSDDPSIAEIRDGIVYMKANGTTIVRAEYGEQKLSCTVIVGSGDGDNPLPPDTDVDLSQYKAWCILGSGGYEPWGGLIIDDANASATIDVTLESEASDLNFGLKPIESSDAIRLTWSPASDDQPDYYNEDTDTFERTSGESGKAVYTAKFGNKTIYLILRYS